MKETTSILLVFSEIQNYDNISTILNQAGHSPNFIEVKTKKEFEKALQYSNPDVIICDAAHPTLPAQELISLRNKNHAHVPCIVSGPDNSTLDVDSFLVAGANDFISYNQLPLLPHIINREVSQIQAVNGHAGASGKNQLLYSVINQSINEVFLMDGDSLRFTFANEALLENMGYTKQEFLNLSFSETVADHHKELVKKMMRPFWEGSEKKITFQKDRLRQDGSYYPVQIHLQHITRGNLHIIAGECFDLSHRKRQKAMLEEQKQITRELRLSNKYKSDFFANLSHEMRTTLNTVLLLSQILTENKANNLNKDQLQNIEAIHNSTNSLLALLNEVLDMAKIESGKMSINLAYLEIVDFCQELERLFQPVASEKGIIFKFINDLNKDIPFKTDRLRLEQVLKNLISNALKFTKKGYVQLRIYQPDESEMATKANKVDTPAIAFQVIDTGIGIPKDEQNQIFQSYTQTRENAKKEEFGGTGLGLTISNEIVHVLGGKIRLDSEVDKGSTFTLYSPIDCSQAILRNAKDGKIKLSTAPSPTTAKPGKEKKNLSGSQKIKGTVLLVDDNLNHNLALKEYLSFKVQQCITAQSAKEAYEILETQPIHCIILDMYLPDADGKEVLKKIKLDKNIQNTPVIIYSGKSLSQQEEDELEKLADAIIQKNVMSYKVLLSKITGILHKVNYSSE